jgi:hypothetical protein
MSKSAGSVAPVDAETLSAANIGRENTRKRHAENHRSLRPDRRGKCFRFVLARASALIAQGRDIINLGISQLISTPEFIVRQRSKR